MQAYTNYSVLLFGKGGIMKYLPENVYTWKNDSSKIQI